MIPCLPPSHKRPTQFAKFYVGAAYYPEHWGAEERERDPARMAAAGFNLVRLAEFSWALLEPSEGTYDFELLDETIARMAAEGIQTMLCTPTAAPPRWLTRKQPEVLGVKEDGQPLQHGSRQHASLSSPVFRHYSRAITQAMAAHFRSNPHVVGWQTDNEFHCHFSECHSEATQEAFREFLRKKYQDSIEALNRAWGCAFWSLTYPDFASIETPRRARPTWPNPAHLLDYHRFLSVTATDFQREQVHILRKTNPDWWIVHNGFFKHLDYRGDFASDLDALGYDSYPMFAWDPAERPAKHALWLDRARAWTGNFLIPEMQSGPGGQGDYFHDNPAPGELRKTTWSSIARGADGVLYFRWRSCRFGAEQYWCGILDHDDIPRRRYAEVCTVGAELRQLGPRLRGTHVRVDVGVAGADAAVNAAHEALSLGLPSPEDVQSSLHRFFFQEGYATGIVHPADDLQDLRWLVIPHWAVFDPGWIPSLENFVRQGGALLVGARTGTKDLFNNVVPVTPPGCLADLCGVDVAEYSKVNSDLGPKLRIGRRSVSSRFWMEILTPRAGTMVVAHWTEGHGSKCPAITLRKMGRGVAVYVGTYFTPELTAALCGTVMRHVSLAPLWPNCPPGVEVSLRTGPREKIWFFLNNQTDPVVLPGLPPGEHFLDGKKQAGGLLLQPREVAVIVQS